MAAKVSSWVDTAGTWVGVVRRSQTTRPLPQPGSVRIQPHSGVLQILLGASPVHSPPGPPCLSPVLRSPHPPFMFFRTASSLSMPLWSTRQSWKQSRCQ